MRAAKVTGALWLLACACGPCQAAGAAQPQHAPRDRELGGHLKLQSAYTALPGDSAWRQAAGDDWLDQALEARLTISARRSGWDLNVHAQFILAHSDLTPGAAGGAPAAMFPALAMGDDRRRFGLTLDLAKHARDAALVRLDRLNVGYATEKTVFRAGRQAISWGNGLLFTPMDIFNPFDPAAVDKEYKTGDDMLYVQRAFGNGDDLQAVAVVRRSPAAGGGRRDDSSLAVKYHGFVGSSEYDLLAARHYGRRVLGLGVSAGVAGAVWRADLVRSATEHGSATSAVAGCSYSWLAGGLNWAGTVEYFHNGFGQAGGDYSAEGLAANPALSERLLRGEALGLGRNYLGASITLEVTPLLNLAPALFVNLGDRSGLSQLVLSYSWAQDIQLLGALGVPFGPAGAEYRGIEAATEGRYLSTGPSFFVQVAWYF